MKQDIPEQWNLVDYCSNCKKAVIGILIGAGDEYSHTECPECDKITESIDIYKYIEPLQSQLKEANEGIQSAKDLLLIASDKVSELKSELKELREERDAFKRLYEGNGTWKVDAERLYDENDELKQEIERLKAGETEQQPEGKVVDEVYKLIDREIMDIRVKINKTLFGNSKQLEVDDLLYKLLSSCPENVVKLIQPQVGEGNTLHTCTNRDKLYSFLYSVTGKHTKEVQWMTDEILNILEPKAEEGNKEKEEK
jgi:uncharacterized phage infection (PIP) family protein YhgE